MMNKPGLYIANSVCMLIICSVLIGAFYFQFGLGENPCPLCLVQRMGMLGVILGLGFNTYFGIRSEHVALVIISALIGATFSIRQVLLHICPVAGEPTGYGSPVLGMYLYSWAVVIFASTILGAALFLILMKDEPAGTTRKPALFEKSVFLLAGGLCLANVLAAFMECQFGPCCENGPCP
jgi:disulfide bond formation protein DsbB